MKQILSFFWELIKVVVLALVIVMPIRYFVFQPFVVKGASMEPSFYNGDYLIVDELSYRFKEPKRGEVIVFVAPSNPSERFIKRIIGLPGETVMIKQGQIEIIDGLGTVKTLDELNYLADSLSWFDDIEAALGQGEYFVLGDNRPHSFDSRNWGALSEGNIIGRVIFRALPVNSVSLISAPSY